MDAENVDYRSDLEAIRETFGTQCVPFNVPVGQGPTFSGVIDVIQSHDEDPPECPLPPTEAYQMVVEQIVEIDEDLMMRYLEGEIDRARRAAQGRPRRDRRRASSFRSSASAPARTWASSELLDLISTCGLSPADVHRFGTRATAEADGAEEEILPAEDGTLVAQVFKTINDQFMGKLELPAHPERPDRARHDAGQPAQRQDRPRPGHIYVLQGKQQEEVQEAIAGDIVAIAKFDDLHVSDTVSNVGGNTTVAAAPGPADQVPDPDGSPRRRAQGARRRGEDLGRARQDRRRGPDLLDPPRCPDPRAGDLGDERPASRRHPAAAQEPVQARDEHARPARALPRDDHRRMPRPTTATRSRPAAAASSARSTCGSGPATRGKGFNFVDAVKGGTIPNQFIPAVEKGVREQMEKGVISGNQVVDVEVEVYFGKDHPVDSSEQAFKTAAATAFRKAFEQAAAGAARADRHDRGDGSRREVRRHLGRPVHPPRPHHRHGFALRRPPGHPGRASRWPRCSRTPPSSRA